MKSISVGELRQNPSEMIADVESGEVYELTRHNHRVGYIVPASSSARIIPRKLAGPARTSELPRRELRTASTIDELLESEKGEW